MAERTLPRLFEQSVGTYPGNVLIWEKSGERYEPSTYAERWRSSATSSSV